MNHRVDLVIQEIRTQALSFCRFAQSCPFIGHAECSRCLQFYRALQKIEETDR